MSVSTTAFWAVIPAAGVGARMAADRPKQYLQLGGRSILEHSLGCFLDHPGLKGLVVSVACDDPFWPSLQCVADPRIVRADGGRERADSVLNALLHLHAQGASDDDWVLVHDAARCLITREQIERLIEACAQDETGGLLAVPLPDTLKCELPRNGLPADVPARVAATVPRDDKWLAQTPQMFRLGVLLQALESGLQHAPEHITDEASAIERLGLQPLLVQGSGWNFKVTYPEDFTLAEAVLLARQNSARAA